MVVGVSTGAAVLIGAGVGVLAAIAGSAAGGFATYKIEQQRQRFERGRDAEREAAIMRGVVRVWADQLGSYAAMLSSMMANPVGPKWWPDDMHRAVAVTTSPEDKKLVTSALTDEQWDQIVLVENAIQVIDNARLFARRALQVSANDFGPAVEPLERTVVQENLPKFEQAAGALLSVIDAGEVEQAQDGDAP